MFDPVYLLHHPAFHFGTEFDRVDKEVRQTVRTTFFPVSETLKAFEASLKEYRLDFLKSLSLLICEFAVDECDVVYEQTRLLLASAMPIVSKQTAIDIAAVVLCFEPWLLAWDSGREVGAVYDCHNRAALYTCQCGDVSPLLTCAIDLLASAQLCDEPLEATSSFPPGTGLPLPTEHSTDFSLKLSPFLGQMSELRVDGRFERFFHSRVRVAYKCEEIWIGVTWDRQLLDFSRSQTSLRTVKAMVSYYGGRKRLCQQVLADVSEAIAQNGEHIGDGPTLAQMQRHHSCTQLECGCGRIHGLGQMLSPVLEAYGSGDAVRVLFDRVTTQLTFFKNDVKQYSVKLNQAKGFQMRKENKLWLFAALDSGNDTYVYERLWFPS